MLFVQYGDCMASDGRMAVELQRILKDAVVA
jgi:hypothetical protein